MKLLLISNMYPSPSQPGFGIFVKNVVDNLPLYGIEIPYKAIITGKKRTIWRKLIAYTRLYSKIIWYYLFKKYDGLYIHFPNQVSPLLLLLRKIKKETLILNLHGSDLLYKQHGLSQKLGHYCELLIRESELIIVPSNYFKTIMQNRQLCDASKILISPSGGIDNKIFYPTHTFSFNNNTLNIGYVGRLEEDKGIMIFLICLQKLIQYQNDSKIIIKAIIVGYGSMQQEIEKFICKFNLKDNVELISGIQQNRLREIYSKIDVLIFPSKNESLGLVGIEALACGTPVIGSNIGGIPSYLKDEYNGYLVPVGDVDALCNAILKFVKLTYSQRKKMRENAIKTAQYYYRDNVIKELACKITNTIKN